MKQNITLAMNKQLLKKARVFASDRGLSVSALLTSELQRMVADETAYEQAGTKAIAQIDKPFRLGGKRPSNRESLHDRQNLR